MKTRKNALLALMSVLALTFVSSGCERTVSRTESEKVRSDGTVESKEKTVTQSSDGTVTKTEEEKKSTPAPPP
ncbi:MAG TPA: hypothetical protein VFZ59_18585 [Verrucomicrobiae bacterium]|nr:hypothetical protein [Verrucomicrobiae bacterium]